MKPLLIILFSLMFLSGTDQRVQLRLIPLNNFDSDIVYSQKKNIETFYNCHVIIGNEISVPKSYFVPSCKRYVADSILNLLETIYPDQQIVGLINKDICTENEDTKYWGIFGLTGGNEKASVISSYRLGKGEIMSLRLQKTVLHEIGHMFGLDHCKTKGCLMEAWDGSMKSFDAEAIWMCPKCTEYLRSKNLLR